MIFIFVVDVVNLPYFSLCIIKHHEESRFRATAKCPNVLISDFYETPSHHIKLIYMLELNQSKTTTYSRHIVISEVAA